MSTTSHAPEEFSAELSQRIDRTCRVRATDAIPKVPNAGLIETRDGVEVQVMHNGVVVEKDCYYGSWMTEVIARLRGHHEPQEEIVFHELVEILRGEGRAPVMVELGSYWGYYSMWLKRAIPETHAVLVEPDPNNLKVGERNLGLNGMAATFIHAAVGDPKATTVRLRCDSDGVTRKVRSMTVDDVVADLSLERIDLLLCDAQGAELEMLRGVERSLREGRIRFMVISTHWLEDDPALHQRCCAAVEQLGGHIIAEHSISESCSVDGLIVTSFDPRDRALELEVPIVRARHSAVGELELHLARFVGPGGVVRAIARLLPITWRERIRNFRNHRAGAT